ncbi:glutamate receptor 2.5-like isoform X2 [Raphanus sativus]|uniref:Glutamate receptor 2.5-like isoform X2 n=1 Tax=Raphanus sativus TaxID=3726 RepID=A0A9W3C4V8_RAPSA|nr:glutamate receptor 2.5-like isoform X2 [Raphanus sativus]
MSFSDHIVSRSLPIWLFIFLIFLVLLGKSQKEVLKVKVGVVLDTNSTLADLSLRAINMSLSELYNTHNGFKTRIVLNIRNSKGTVVGAAASALYLINKRKVVAIIGPGTSMQAPFLINLGNQSQVPIVTFSATSPLLDSLRSPYFIRATHDDSAQVHAISAIIESFRWREVVPIYVDNEFGEGILPYLVDAFQEINVRIRYRSAISIHSTDDQIKKELYRLMTMPTRVFILHMLPDPGSRLFKIAREIGMMNKGYAWIVTNGIIDLMSLRGGPSLEDMHGVLGVKTYFPRSKELAYLEARWRKRFGGEELTHFGYWAYDAATALAMSVEQISNENMSFNTTKNISRGDNGTDLDDLDVALSGPKLLQALSTVTFKGVAGRFLLENRKLEPTTFKIINIEESGERAVGFWKSKVGLVKRLGVDQIGTNISHSSRGLRTIIWPGDTTLVPKGWEIPINGKKLRIAVPKKDGFNNFLKVTKDANTNALTITGFCIDVFDAVMRQLPYAVPYEYVPFETPDGKGDGNYNNMVYKVFLGEFDGAVGDTTILANRSNYVDFALPYSETGVVFVVPVKDEREKGEWVFLKPLTKQLWCMIAAAFIYIGLVVWIFEYIADPTFRTQRFTEKISNVFYFSFSTLFFAHRKPSTSIYTRGLVVIWCFVVLILTQSYTATLTSMLTVQELRPTVRHMDDLKKSGVNIGYQKGSFTLEKLKQEGFKESKFKIYNSPEEMRELFLKTSSNGGIDAAFDEVPYVKLFMAKYCQKYTIIEPTYKADGFGFAFPLGSPLVPDISREILNLTEGETMRAIENKWFVEEKNCPDRNTTDDTPIQLDHHSFQALFMIVFASSLLLLFIMLSCRRYQEGRGNMNGDPPNPPGDGPDDHLLLFLLILASRRYQQRRGNIIGAQSNPPGDGPDGQDNARANQNREVNEGGAAEPADNEHRIVEVREGVNIGDGDGDGDHESHRIGKVNVQLQRQQSQVRRRCNKLFSEKNMPLGMAASP